LAAGAAWGGLFILLATAVDSTGRHGDTAAVWYFAGLVPVRPLVLLSAQQGESRPLARRRWCGHSLVVRSRCHRRGRRACCSGRSMGLLKWHSDSSLCGFCRGGKRQLRTRRQPRPEREIFSDRGAHKITQRRVAVPLKLSLRAEIIWKIALRRPAGRRRGRGSRARARRGSSLLAPW
jgi:hypothetical protein